MVLRVKLEIVPFGEEEEAFEIGRLDIFNSNQAGGTSEYGIINLTPKHIGLYLDRIYHRRSDGAWALVREVLKYLEVAGP